MLIVPFLAGVALRARVEPLPWSLVPLLATWLLGYFTFHAASTWLKAPPRRRPRFVRPVLTYAALTAVAGALTLASSGLPILGWVPWYLPLLLPALWLAAQRRERATIGGALTIAAASLMTLVARFTDPADALRQANPDAVVAALGLFAYFFGTVLYVKTNIRERGNPRFTLASVGWHAAWTLVATWSALAEATPWWWVAFFAATTVRAAIIPRLRPAWTAKRIGILEAVFSVALLAGIALG